jgi:pimeloyl-ACP methyl ester carboxylesterase
MKRHIRLSLMFAAVAALSSTIATQPSLAQTPSPAARHATASTVSNKTITIDGLDIFYREAGPKTAPTLLLLHGFPTSSHMFRDLIPALADKYHVIAPDYPGFGYSSMPKVNEFDYSFDNLASVVEKFTEKVGLTRYSLYLMDYGAPVGFRIAAKHPERIETLIIQNGNAYDEGINNIFWEPIKEYWIAMQSTRVSTTHFGKTSKPPTTTRTYPTKTRCGSFSHSARRSGNIPTAFATSKR